MSELQSIFQVRAQEFVSRAVTLSMEALRMNQFKLRPQRMVITKNYIGCLSNMLSDYMYQADRAGRVEVPEYFQDIDSYTKFNGLVTECLKNDKRIAPEFVP